MPGNPTASVSILDENVDVAMQHSHWRMRGRLSSAGDALDTFLGQAGYDRGPWLAVAFAAGIAAWFALRSPLEWAAILAAGLIAALLGMAGGHGEGIRVHLRLALISLGLCLATGVGAVWVKSEMVGAEPITRPSVVTVDGLILDRIEQPAEERVRLVLATRNVEHGRAIKIRVNLPIKQDDPRFAEGAIVRLKSRLMPPQPPMLPGGYDFARAAWFQGLAATGSVLGEPVLLKPAPDRVGLGALQRRLADHVRAQVDGSAGTIAAALASGDRGAITKADDDAMRDSGLSHLLSISGLHVSAVIAAIYVLAIKLLALWQWLALRVRLPVAAAGIAALGGIAYTLLTGAEVPTVRSCIGAVLVLLALALGREPLSLRMVALAAGFVLWLWPEALIGPSFQMSFAAVIAIVALHGCAPVRAFLAPRDQGWLAKVMRNVAMLLFTGLVIEIALMPIVLFHFHRAGLYGAFANVVAIPLTTFVTMPMIALALLLDAVGLGGPVWWLVGKSIEAVLWLAHFTSSQPGAVKLMPQMGGGTFALFVAGGLWLGFWRGKARLLSLAPLSLATILLVLTPVPDVFITGDGRHVGIAGEGDRLLMLRDSRSDFTRDNLLELAGMEGETLLLDQWPGAKCTADFCAVTLPRGGRDWHLLMARSKALVSERELAAACDRADIVVAERRLPGSCKPRWIKADRRMLEESGGLAISLEDQSVRSVAQTQGEHGWWKGQSRD